jgi:hypothetical protein
MPLSPVALRPHLAVGLPLSSPSLGRVSALDRRDYRLWSAPWPRRHMATQSMGRRHRDSESADSGDALPMTAVSCCQSGFHPRNHTTVYPHERLTLTSAWDGRPTMLPGAARSARVLTIGVMAAVVGLFALAPLGGHGTGEGGAGSRNVAAPVPTGPPFTLPSNGTRCLGATFTGGTWTSACWQGAGWPANPWLGGTWSGGQWSDGAWSGGTWSGGTWSGGASSSAFWDATWS